MTLPTITPWRDLRPGDLAWDPGDGDLVTGRYAPLLLVCEDGVGRWHSASAVEVTLNPIDWSDPLGRGGAACPWAVLLARDIPRDQDRILAAVEAVGASARKLVRGAEADPTARAEERQFWPFTAELLGPGEAPEMKNYRWRIESGADGPRVVAEHKYVGAAIDRWAAVRNPDTLAKLRGLTPEGK